MDPVEERATARVELPLATAFRLFLRGYPTGASGNVLWPIPETRSLEDDVPDLVPVTSTSTDHTNTLKSSPSKTSPLRSAPVVPADLSFSESINLAKEVHAQACEVFSARSRHLFTYCCPANRTERTLRTADSNSVMPYTWPEDWQSSPPEENESLLMRFLSDSNHEGVHSFLSHYLLYPEAQPDSYTLEEYKEFISQLGPRMVCQYAFGPRDMVWSCRTCQRGETYVLCDSCFQASDHTNHDVYFFENGSGCCDCGDANSWDPAGFCPHHGHRDPDPVSRLPDDVKRRAIGIIKSIFELLELYFSIVKNGGTSISAINPITPSTVGNALVEETLKLALPVDYGEDIMKENLSSLLSLDTEMESENAKWCYVMITPSHPDATGIEEIASTILTFLASLVKPDYALLEADAVLVQLETHGFVLFPLLLAVESYKELEGFFESRNMETVILSPQALSLRKAVLSSLTWLQTLTSNDGLMQLICNILTEDNRIKNVLMTFGHVDTSIGHAIYGILLSAMAITPFKTTMTIAYSEVYRKAMLRYTSFLSFTPGYLFQLAVQFLTREDNVLEAVFGHKMCDSLINSLFEALEIRESDFNGSMGEVRRLHILDSNVIRRNRHLSIMSDLRSICTFPKAARYFCTVALDNWLSFLAFLHCFHNQQRQRRGHVEYESKKYKYAMHLILTIVSSYEYMLNWFSETDAHDYIEIKWERKQIWLTSVQMMMRKVTEKILRLQSDDHNSLSSIIRSFSQSDFASMVMSPKKWPEISPTFSSFHNPLYKFFSQVITEICRYPTLSSIVYEAIYSLEREPAAPYVFLVNVLKPIVFANEIYVGMWRGNGTSMLFQATKYTEQPVARFCYSLDLPLMGIASMACSTSVFWYTLLDSFHVLQYIFPRDMSIDEETKRPDSPTDESLETEKDCKEDEKSFGAGLVASLLKLLVQMLTELPSPPPPNEEESKAMESAAVRREWIHLLAAEDCTHSTLIDALEGMRPGNSAISALSVAARKGVFDDILGEVAVRKSLATLQTPMYSLRRECWKEYDPCFSRLGEAQHQRAVDRRPRPETTSSPISPPLSTPHLTFATVRWRVLACQPCFLTFRQILSARICQVPTACRLLPTATADRYIAFKRVCSLRCTDFTVSAVLQLLTILVYELRCDSTPSAELQAKRNDAYTLFTECYGVSSSYSASLLTVLSDIYSIRKSLLGDVDAAALVWILDELFMLGTNFSTALSILRPGTVDPKGTTSVLSPVQVAQQENASAKSAASARQKAALDAIQLRAAEFLKMFGDVDDDDEDDDDDINVQPAQKQARTDDSAASTVVSIDESSSNAMEVVPTPNPDVPPTPEVRVSSPESDNDEMTCIICQSCDNAPMVFLAHVQPSDVMSTPHDCCLHASSSSDIAGVTSGGLHEGQVNTVETASFELEKLNLRVSCCGHVMHDTCFTRFTLESISRYHSSHSIILAATEQFVCPLCTKLNNAGLRVSAFSSAVNKKSSSSSSIETAADDPNDYVVDSDDKSHNTVEWLMKNEPINVDTIILHPDPVLKQQMKLHEPLAMLLFERFIPSSDICHVQLLISSIAYTIATVATEYPPAYNLLVPSSPHPPSSSSSESDVIDSESLPTTTYSRGTDELLHLNQFAALLCRYGGGLLLHAELLNLLVPLLQQVSTQSLKSSTYSYWIRDVGASVLHMPICDVIVALECFAMSPGHYVGQTYFPPLYNCTTTIQHLVRTLFLVALTQRLLLVKTPTASMESSPLEECLTASGLSPTLHPLIISIYSAVPTGMDITPISPEHIRESVLWWLALLRTWMHLVCRLPSTPRRQKLLGLLRENPEIQSSLSPASLQEAVLVAHLRCVGLEEITNPNICANDSFTDVFGRWITNYHKTMSRLDIVDTQLSLPPSFFAYPCYSCYPRWKRPNFIPLPESYIQLHVNVKTLGAHALTAVCLRCGVVLNGQGHGYCSAHANKCGAGVGVFYLVQSCNVLLIMSGRSSYFPGIYVDEYGESRHSLRGKPLKLHAARLEALRSLWIDHRVSAEIARFRVSADVVVALNYF